MYLRVRRIDPTLLPTHVIIDATTMQVLQHNREGDDDMEHW